MKYSLETKEVGAGWNGDSGFRFRLVVNAVQAHSVNTLS